MPSLAAAVHQNHRRVSGVASHIGDHTEGIGAGEDSLLDHVDVPVPGAVEM
jgi:hypothetical protein